MILWCPLSSGNQPQVESQNEEHECEEEDQTGVSERDNDAFAGRFAADSFVDQKDHVTAIQKRNRQEVEDGEVGAEHRQENQEFWEALFRFGSRHFSDP